MIHPKKDRLPPLTDSRPPNFRRGVTYSPSAADRSAQADRPTADGVSVPFFVTHRFPLVAVRRLRRLSRIPSKEADQFCSGPDNTVFCCTAKEGALRCNRTGVIRAGPGRPLARPPPASCRHVSCLVGRPGVAWGWSPKPPGYWVPTPPTQEPARLHRRICF